MRIFPLFCFFAAVVIFAVALAETAFAGARIYRDAEGVAHVYADSNRELFHGFGYLIGKDRLFQAEMRKLQALGRRAEFLGRTDQPRWADKFVEKDLETRRSLDLDGLQAQIDDLPDADREIIEAYADGLNAAIREALENDGAGLPEAFARYGFEPTEWTLLDVVATTADVLAGYSDFTVQEENLALYRFLAEKFPESCDDVFEQLLWRDDAYALTTVGDHKQVADQGADTSPLGCHAREGDMPNGLALRGDFYAFASAGEPAVERAMEPRRASMAWAVGGQRAERGGSIFLSGPQTGWHRPSYYYTVGLHGGDFDFIGMAAEAMPVFQVGFNRHYAWGMTAGLGIQSDLFALNVSGDGDRYTQGEEDIAFATRPETVKVKDEGPVTATVLESVYGPVVSHTADSSIAYAKSVPWRGAEVASHMAWLRASAAMSEDEWRARVQAVAFNYNLFYADRDGKVGFAYTGRFPTRAPDADPRFPIRGDGSLDHVGLTLPEDTVIQVTEDMIFNFNNRPHREFPNSGIFWEQWTRGNQVEILADAIGEWPDKVDWSRVWNLNQVISDTDVNWYPFRQIFADAVRELDDSDPLFAAAQAVLAWDGQRVDHNGDGYFDAVGLTVFDRWIDVLVRQTLGATLEGAREAGAGAAAGYYLGHVHQRLPARLEEHPSGGTLATYRAFLADGGAPGIAHAHDFFGGVPPAEAVRTALSAAISELTERFDSTDVADWRTGTTRQSYFPTNADRTPMSVTGTVTHKGVFANRGGVNLVVEYGADGSIARAGFANPLGGTEDLSVDQPSDYHLDIYADQALAPLDLVGEGQLTEDGADLVIEFQ